MSTNHPKSQTLEGMPACASVPELDSWEAKRAKREANTQRRLAEGRPTEKEAMYFDSCPRSDAVTGLPGRINAFRPSEITWDPKRPGARKINQSHVDSIVATYRAGIDVPPITIWNLTKRENKGPHVGVSVPKAAGRKGLHRYMAHVQVYGDKPIACISMEPVAYDPEPDEYAPGETYQDDEVTVLRDKLSTLGDNLQRHELTPDERAQQMAEYVAGLTRLSELEPPAPIEPEPTFVPWWDVKQPAPKPKKGRPKKAASARDAAASLGRSKSAVHRDLQKAKGVTPQKRPGSEAEPETSPDPTFVGTERASTGASTEEKITDAPTAPAEPKSSFRDSIMRKHEKDQRTETALRAENTRRGDIEDRSSFTPAVDPNNPPSYEEVEAGQPVPEDSVLREAGGPENFRTAFLTRAVQSVQFAQLPSGSRDRRDGCCGPHCRNRLDEARNCLGKGRAMTRDHRGYRSGRT